MSFRFRVVEDNKKDFNSQKIRKVSLKTWADILATRLVFLLSHLQILSHLKFFCFCFQCFIFFMIFDKNFCLESQKLLKFKACHLSSLYLSCFTQLQISSLLKIFCFSFQCFKFFKSFLTKKMRQVK